MRNVPRLPHILHQKQRTNQLSYEPFVKPFDLLLALFKALATLRHQPVEEKAPDMKQSAEA